MKSATDISFPERFQYYLPKHRSNFCFGFLSVRAENMYLTAVIDMKIDD